MGKTEVIPVLAIDKIQAYPTPTTVKELQTFWGLLGYWRASVPHLVQVVHLLYSLVKRGANWDWTLTLEQVFQQVKHIIKCAQGLAYSGPC